MNKLPFVWELNYKGIISHGVGIYHRAPNKYQKNIEHLLEGKKRLLVEESFIGDHFDPPFQLDPAIQDFAYARLKLKIVPLETKKENERAGLIYKNKPPIKCLGQKMANAYFRGDEKTLRTLVELDHEENFSKKDIIEIRRRNRIIGLESLEHLTRYPCMMAVGVFHFMAYQPTLIDFYKEKGIEVKRVQ